jgi:hypothetical protein
MVRNRAPENLEIPGLVLTHHPGMTEQQIDSRQCRDQNGKQENANHERQGASCPHSL